MIHDEVPSVALYNVAETTPEWTDGGYAFRRVPQSVSDELNVSARERMAARRAVRSGSSRRGAWR